MHSPVARSALRALVLAIALSAAGAGDAVTQGRGTTVVPGTFTLADFRGLRFVEGWWKGSGYAPGPFYESYRFANDSTLEMSAWTDATFATRDGDGSRYVFRAGRIRTADGRAVLTHIDSLGYHFSTLGTQPHRWVFRRVSPDRWTATLGPRTVYTMDRVKGRDGTAVRPAR